MNDNGMNRKGRRKSERDARGNRQKALRHAKSSGGIELPVKVPDWFGNLTDDERAEATQFLRIIVSTKARPEEKGMSVSALHFARELSRLRERVQVAFGKVDTEQASVELVGLLRPDRVQEGMAFLQRVIFGVRLDAARRAVRSDAAQPLCEEREDAWLERLDVVVNPVKYEQEEHDGDKDDEGGGEGG